MLTGFIIIIRFQIKWFSVIIIQVVYVSAWQRPNRQLHAKIEKKTIYNKKMSLALITVARDYISKVSPSCGIFHSHPFLLQVTSRGCVSKVVETSGSDGIFWHYREVTGLCCTILGICLGRIGRLLCATRVVLGNQANGVVVFSDRGEQQSR